jgi:hypothetical protein
MRLRFNFGKNDTNHHGTQAAGEAWDRKMVCGWKLRCIDLLGPIKEREAANPEGGRTRAKWYKRLILYFPDGSWWNLDIALVTALKAGKQ